MTKLLLAEGDFSYAATQAGPLVACAFDAESCVIKKYGAVAEARLEKLRRRQGVTLVFGLDATKTMHKGALPAEAVDINSIEIRFPHTGIKSVASNRILLQGIITACTRLLVSPLCVSGCTLSISLKTTGRYNEWAGDIQGLARAENLLLLSASRPVNPVGYEHVQTNPNQQSVVQLDQACTYVFQRKEFCVSPLDALPSWLVSEIGERCSKCEACDKIFSSLGDLEKHLEGKQHARKMMAMNSAGGRRKEKRRRELAIKHEMEAEEKERVGRPKSKKELRMERKRAKMTS